MAAAGLNVQAPTASAAPEPAGATPANATRTSDSDTALTYSEGWIRQSNASAGGGTLHVTGKEDSRVVHEFTGVSVKVFTKKGPRAAILDVYLDGEKTRSFDTYAPTHEYGVLAYEVADLPLGTHTIEIRHSGRTNPAALPGSFVHLDHIDTTDRPGVQAYADLGFGMFVHYGINTYNGHTGHTGNPREYPSTLFHPSDFDPDQWASAAEAAGMRYLIYTVKHHYGWTGYPTAYGDDPRYNIATSSAPQLDTLKETVQAAREHNLVPVIYYSSWDRYNYVIDGNNRNPSYTEFVKNQLDEMLSGEYGDIPVLWMDISDHLTDAQNTEITTHAKRLRPGITVVLNKPSTAPAGADIRNYESNEGPGADAIHPATTDRSTSIGTDVCPTGEVAGWWAFDESFDPQCKGWTRDGTLAMRAGLNARNSTFGLNVPPGPSGRLSPAAEKYLRSLAPADDRDRRISYSPGWHYGSATGAHLDTLRYAGRAGASASYNFTGTSVSVETKLGPGAGIMDILIDGTKVASFDSWSPRHVDRAIAYETQRLAPGLHTVEIVATGTRNPQSTGSLVHLDSIQHFNQPS